VTRRIEPSPAARRVLIGAARDLPRTYPSISLAFPDERARTTEYHPAPGLMPAIARAMRALLTPKGPTL
jgi:hypothetical protein